MKNIFFLLVMLSFHSAFAASQIVCQSSKDRSFHNFKVTFSVVNDNSIAEVEVSLLNPKTGQYNHLVSKDVVESSNFNSRYPLWKDLNRFQIQKSEESSYSLLLPKNVSALSSERFDAYVVVAFDKGRPFNDYLSCNNF